MNPGEKPRVVLDTNVVLNALSPKLPYRVILKKLLAGSYELCATTEILLEYEEKITEFYSQTTASTLLDAFTMSSHFQKVEVFFRFNILSDSDDNKFIDCAFAANAHFLVTDDRDFRVLKGLVFPKIDLLSIDEFSRILV